jgi:hypothetical protein
MISLSVRSLAPCMSENQSRHSVASAGCGCQSSHAGIIVKLIRCSLERNRFMVPRARASRKLASIRSDSLNGVMLRTERNGRFPDHLNGGLCSSNRKSMESTPQERGEWGVRRSSSVEQVGRNRGCGTRWHMVGLEKMRLLVLEWVCWSMYEPYVDSKGRVLRKYYAECMRNRWICHSFIVPPQNP